jgi:hypothetical protein
MSKEYVCETCGKEYKTRAGLWKHQKRYKHGKYAEDPESESEKIVEDDGDSLTPDESSISSESSDTIPIESTAEEDRDSSSTAAPNAEDHASAVDTPDQESDQPDWMSFQFSKEEGSTDQIPTTFKAAVASGSGKKGKLTKAEREALIKRNTAILKLGLTSVDHLLSKYAQAVTLDPDMIISHSESDKDLVANAQMAYLEEKGLFLTNYLSTGVVAASLTAWYVGSPIIRIRKKAKRKLFKSRGLLARLPLIGRFFRRKKTQLDHNGDLVIVDDE